MRMRRGFSAIVSPAAPRSAACLRFRAPTAEPPRRAVAAAAGTSNWMVALTVFSALGGLLFGYDTGVVASAALFIDLPDCDLTRLVRHPSR